MDRYDNLLGVKPEPEEISLIPESKWINSLKEIKKPEKYPASYATIGSARRSDPLYSMDDYQSSFRIDAHQRHFQSQMISNSNIFRVENDCIALFDCLRFLPTQDGHVQVNDRLYVSAPVSMYNPTPRTYVDSEIKNLYGKIVGILSAGFFVITVAMFVLFCLK